MTQQSGQTLDREVKINYLIVLGSGPTEQVCLKLTVWSDTCSR